MTEVILDGQEMVNREATHKYIKDKLSLPSYYGENLDALWDMIVTYDRDIQIRLINKEALAENLGQYGKDIIGIFMEASRENNNIRCL
ncbi:MAG: barstar family protein [Epulopiscium sp.]|nr:barstar family protein [Candidatus Epulonipiscium sp.]